MTGTDPELNVPLNMPLDGQTGPAVRQPRDHATAMLGAAMLEYDRIASAAPARGGSRASWAPWAMAAGALLTLVGGAAAARYYFDFGAPQPPAAAITAPVRAPLEPAVVPFEAPIAQPVPDESESDSDAPSRAPDKRGRAAVRGAPEDLLQKANQQRSAGEFRDAAQTYALVYERFPRSLSAYVARVAGAAIELEHLSNPTRARKLFEQALHDRPQGALDLEARQGLSLSLRDLEDRPAERRVLTSLIGAHPDSPAARRAQVRLREIGGE